MDSSIRKEAREVETTRVVVGVVVGKDGRILVGKRVLDGKWELIGGKADKPGATLESELRDRIDERVGPIGVLPKHLLWQETQRNENISNHVIFMRCDLPLYKLPIIHPDIHLELVWKEGNDLANLSMIKRDERFANSYAAWRARI